MRRSIAGDVNGKPIERIEIGDPKGFHVALLSLGASIAECHAPGRDGYADVALGFENIGDYTNIREYFGATCGRFTNRIGDARFTLDDKTFLLDANEGSTSLHGGHNGFDRFIWRIDAADDESVRFARRSPDGEGGYPGNLDVMVEYRVRGDTLTIDISATTDAPTITNIVNHGYWNLGGHGAGDISEHVMEIAAARVVAIDGDKVPTGELDEVDGTPFDFRAARPVGRNAAETQIDGYDHCFCTDGPRGELHRLARVETPQAGRRLDIFSTEVGLQIYTAEHFNGSYIGKGGIAYGRRAGLALETQTWPDAPNHPHFPSARLDPGENYRHITEFRFSAM